MRALTSFVICATVAPCVRYANESIIASRTVPGFRLGGSEYFTQRDNRRLDVLNAMTKFYGILWHNSPGWERFLGSMARQSCARQNRIDDLNLPPSVQALIETRINAAVEQLREDNRTELGRLISKHTRKWQVIAGILFLINVGSWFIAPNQIKKWAKDYVQKHMTAPELKKAADEAIRTQMADYVRSQIEPVKRDVQDNQQQLERAQISINGQVHVQQLAIASKAGGLAEFVELKKLSESGVETANAQTALKEVELYFDTDRGQLSHPTLVDPISKQSP